MVTRQELSPDAVAAIVYALVEAVNADQVRFEAMAAYCVPESYELFEAGRRLQTLKDLEALFRGPMVTVEVVMQVNSKSNTESDGKDNG